MPSCDFKTLNGMHWSIGAFDFDIPFIGDTEKATYIFNQNLVDITWNCLRTLEQNPSTLPQTRTILNGKSVDGLDVNDLLQIKNYGDGAKELVRLLRAGKFRVAIESACDLHRFVGYKDALEWGTLRNLNTGIHDVEYVLPSYEKLPMLAKNGFEFLNTEVKDPKEQAIAVFLFMARTQFFFDANKRTASLMMNGCLMLNGYWPITVLNQESTEFHQRLGQFYETGDANEMMAFFARSVKKLYIQNGRNELGSR